MIYKRIYRAIYKRYPNIEVLRDAEFDLPWDFICSAYCLVSDVVCAECSIYRVSPKLRLKQLLEPVLSNYR